MDATGSVGMTGDSLIPDVLRRQPNVRAVLDRYGLKGCGGPEGPHESLRIFARAHGVELEQLIGEMKHAALSSHQPAPAPSSADLGDVIYRRFFLAAVIFLLSVGATWGAHLLAKIAIAQSFTAASPLQIQAHGQAQVFGWMCLAIMGFAYQAFPRFWHTSLANDRRANLSFWLMVIGVVAAAAGISAAGAAWALPIGVVGGTCELTASLLFSWELFATFRQSKRPFEAYIAYIASATIWFIASSAFNLVHIWGMLMNACAGDAHYAALVDLVQSPMRDIQFHGVGLTIILGVSLRTLPHIFGTQKPVREFEWAMLVMITCAVCMEAINPFFKVSFAIAPTLLLWIVSVAAPIGLRVWQRFPDGDRSEKFIKAGWCWLIVSQSLLLLAPAYFSVAGISNQHAYSGAIRHAITVGFISLMIMGYAAKVVATLNGYDPRKLSNLLLPFVLVNLGCSMRVFGQVFTDLSSAAFPVTGVSGVLETTGMAIWGIQIARLILVGRKNAQESVSMKQAPEVLDQKQLVGEILDWYPQTIPVFQDFGLSAVISPVMRRTIGRQVTVEKACKLHTIDVQLFVLLLNSAIAPRAKCVGCTGNGCGEEKPEAERCH